MRLAILDLGCGNLGSVAIAFERFGMAPVITAEPDTIASADKVVLPGQGRAGYAMEQLQARGLDGLVRDLKQPVLGICLGMQMLFERSEEDDAELLGVIPGKVGRMDADCGRPVPHMGWSALTLSPLPPAGGAAPQARGGPEVDGPTPALRASPSRKREGIGLLDGDYVYFAHSYACPAGPHVLASASYGPPVPAVVRAANFTGAQFHPEKSGAAGARFLESWLGP